MEIAMGIMGVALTLLGVILAYMWRSNGKIQSQMMSALERIEQGQKEIMQGQKEIAQAVSGVSQMVREVSQTLKDVSQMVKDVSQMALNQSRILERIEAKLP